MLSDIKRGFTLIELLVVIAIIAVLAAILFPIFAKAREKAWQSTCLSNQRQIAAALLMYIQDNEETFMPGPNSPQPDTTVWCTKLNGLPAEVYHCPTTSDPGSSATPNYGLNFSLYGQTLGNLPNPANIPMLADYNALNARASYQIIDWDNDIDPRHATGVILACLDGHVVHEALPGTSSIPTMTQAIVSNLGTLVSRGYTPYVNLPITVDLSSQVSGYASASAVCVDVTALPAGMYCSSTATSAPAIYVEAELQQNDNWNHAFTWLNIWGVTGAAFGTSGSNPPGVVLGLCGGANVTSVGYQPIWSQYYMLNNTFAIKYPAPACYPSGGTQHFYGLRLYIIDGYMDMVWYDDGTTGGMPGSGASFANVMNILEIPVTNLATIAQNNIFQVVMGSNGSVTQKAQNVRLYSILPSQ